MWFEVGSVQKRVNIQILLDAHGNPQNHIDLKCFIDFSDQTSVWLHCDNTTVQLQAEGQQRDLTAHRVQKTLRHIFLSKTVSL